MNMETSLELQTLSWKFQDINIWIVHTFRNKKPPKCDKKPAMSQLRPKFCKDNLIDFEDFICLLSSGNKIKSRW